MATAIVMPKLGNSVESTIIVGWKKAVGDAVAEGETLCEVETDKAVMEVPSTVNGTLLLILREVNDEVPVLDEIAVIGSPGEDVSGWERGEDAAAKDGESPAPESTPPPAPQPSATGAAEPTSAATASEAAPASPRARRLAAQHQIELGGLQGSGPVGRIIERDVAAALEKEATTPKLTPVAQAMVASGAYTPPDQGSGPGGRVMKGDLLAAESAELIASAAEQSQEDEVEVMPLKGVRKVIAQRMLASLQTTAQLTLHATADARALQSLRARFKASPEPFGLQRVTINDLVLLAVSRALVAHPELNALFEENAIARHRSVNLGIAVDTPKGLMVPVIRKAHARSLKNLSAEAKRLATTAQAGKATLDDLSGGTFTVTNLGAFGIESFTPVLNPPQVGILGVGSIELKPTAQADGEVAFIPHIGLSLTINHQVVDGAPAARFLQTLSENIAGIDLLLAG